MSSKRCCVPQCVEVEGSYRVLHWFPNPDKDIARFRTWVHAIGGDILSLSNENIYKLCRVCHAHFEEKYCCRNNKISNIAVPTLLMPGPLSISTFICADRKPLREVENLPSTSKGANDIVLHKFPNPNKDPTRFLTWVQAVGGNLLCLDNMYVFNYRRICHMHFEPKYWTRSKCLSNIAIPTLQMKENAKANDEMECNTSTNEQNDQPDNVIDDEIECTDMKDVTVWAAEPDVCRCCLTSNGSKDLLAANINEAGEKQVYSEILKSCFGISLSSLTEWGPGRLLCDVCVARLLDADTFKKQVLQAELLFVTYNNKQENAKANDDMECNTSTNEQNDQPDNVIDEPSHRNASNEHIDYSSETELEQSNLDISLTRSNLDKSPTRSKDSTSEDHYYDDVDNVAINVTIPSVPLKPVIKRISERKRIKITCETILRATTACPFRHHSSWFQCFFCNQTFINISSLRTHYIHTHKDIDEVLKLKRFPRSLQIDITEFNCKLCSLNLCDVESMQAHLKEAHQLVIYKECIADYKINGSPYSCHICGEDFHVFRTLTTHLNEHYPNFICDVCGKSFMNSKRLKVHNRTHESGNFPCAQCGKVMKTKAAIDNHMETHSRRVIRCQICSKPMKHYNDRIKHMSEEHNITHKFKCLICAREFNIKHYLATHIRQTHGHKNKKCSECGMAFITNHGLKKHMQRHSGVKA